MGEYLTKAEFFEYMKTFEVKVEKRFGELAAKIDNGQKDSCNKLRGDLVRILLGAVLALSGVAAASTFLRGLF